LEAEILDRESEVEHLSSQLLDPAVLRDGRRVRELQAVTAAARERLAELYAHYDEALELNGEAR
jgi:ATP-binding cassette subfamily F protein 3